MHVFALGLTVATMLIAATAKPHPTPQLFAVKVGKQVVQAYAIGHGDFRDCRNHRIPRFAISGKPRPLLGRCAPLRPAVVPTPRATRSPVSVSSPALTPAPPPPTPTPHSVRTPAVRQTFRPTRDGSNGVVQTLRPEAVSTTRSEPTPPAVQTPGKFLYRLTPPPSRETTRPGPGRVKQSAATPVPTQTPRGGFIVHQRRIPRPLPTRTP